MFSIFVFFAFFFGIALILALKKRKRKESEKKTEFAKARIVADGKGSPVPGMSFYDDVDMEVEHIGIEDFCKADIVLAPASQGT